MSGQRRGLVLAEVRPGDRVTILDRFGKERTGRVVMPAATGEPGWVLNMGGSHGTPAVVTSSNFVRATGKRPPKRAPWGIG